MTLQQKKQYLLQAKYLDGVIRAELEQLQDLRCMITTVRSIDYIEKVQSSVQGDKATDIINKIVDLEREINSDIDKLVNLKKEITICIGTVKEPICKAILIHRYLNFKTYEEIAECMNYSLKQIYRIHKQAIQKLNI